MKGDAFGVDGKTRKIRNYLWGFTKRSLTTRFRIPFEVTVHPAFRELYSVFDRQFKQLGDKKAYVERLSFLSYVFLPFMWNTDGRTEAKQRTVRQPSNIMSER